MLADYMHKTVALSADAKRPLGKPVTMYKVKPRPVSQTPAASTQAAVQEAVNCNAVEFPLCDAAVRKIDSGDWDLADAIVAECSETGDDGVRNESYPKMEGMRQEIAANHGVHLSFERIRKLRKVASAFPPGRRRPAVCRSKATWKPVRRRRLTRL